ncbi:putative membrane protein [Arcticibacter tournemirensis]|uniref:DUF2231 domain-containing protein n=1 Tax=Arcticibacter tournemirensis TaxID=699437 RepID=A0A5M9GL92_9SPHI|nr:DUF2231 domain-containing protein [Arcticibacter tournemirensis]KAA8475453.1 hypothetical protein F1649_21535 [Arcticibacter tournemirensis]TQM51749.1 putative membrane protein [Arcticibacter tournemirensis]
MDKVSAIWRTELWHPLSVHYPIAFLILSTILGILIFILGNRHNFETRLRFTMSLLLWSGTLLLWLAFYTGKLAYSVEVRRICDPFVLKNHLYWANVTSFVFSAATITDVLQKIAAIKINKLLVLVTVILMIAGSICLGYTGHLGASLVYEQGAGVHQPASDCSDYK